MKIPTIDLSVLLASSLLTIVGCKGKNTSVTSSDISDIEGYDTVYIDCVEIDYVGDTCACDTIAFDEYPDIPE